MAKKRSAPQRRRDALSRARIVEAAIAVLDDAGEDDLTFRNLAERLSTGAGAIYWHIASKAELMTAACDAIIANTIAAVPSSGGPTDALRALALGLFDTIDSHFWVGSALALAPGQLPMVRISESIGRQVQALGVPPEQQWAVVGALLNYILGVGGRNAANRQFARKHNLNRSNFLQAVSTAWSQLDPNLYPFTRSLAEIVPKHDDRMDFLAGIDLILKGVGALPDRRRKK